jgi:hypothetical protein
MAPSAAVKFKTFIKLMSGTSISISAAAAVLQCSNSALICSLKFKHQAPMKKNTNAKKKIFFSKIRNFYDIRIFCHVQSIGIKVVAVFFKNRKREKKRENGKFLKIIFT